MTDGAKQARLPLLTDAAIGKATSMMTDERTSAYRAGAQGARAVYEAELSRLRETNAELLDLCERALLAWTGAGPGIVLDDLRAGIAKAKAAG